MRHTRSTLSAVSRTSHSSRHQLASDHHCPLTRHGPAISRTAYRCPSQKTRAGALPTSVNTDGLRWTADTQSGWHREWWLFALRGWRRCDTESCGRRSVDDRLSARSNRPVPHRGASADAQASPPRLPVPVPAAETDHAARGMARQTVRAVPS